MMLSKKFSKGSIAEVGVDKKGEIVVEVKKPPKILSPINGELLNKELQKIAKEEKGK